MVDLGVLCNDVITLRRGAASVVELDVLTGQGQVLSSVILFDCGESINPAVDIGQIEGGFIQVRIIFAVRPVS